MGLNAIDVLRCCVVYPQLYQHHQGKRQCPGIITEGLPGSIGSDEVLETAPNCAQGDPHAATRLGHSSLCQYRMPVVSSRRGVYSRHPESLGTRPYRPAALSTVAEECPERRGTALFNTKLPEATAEDVINRLGEGCSVRATNRLVQVANETVARLLRVTGRHAEQFHEQHVHGLTAKALEFDEQWSFVKKSRSVVRRMKKTLAICGTIQPWQQTANWWSVS